MTGFSTNKNFPSPSIATNPPSRRSTKGAPDKTVSEPVVLSLLYPRTAEVLVVTEPDPYTRCCVTVCAKAAGKVNSNNAVASAAQTKKMCESTHTARSKLAMNHSPRHTGKI